jgi:zinc and cadmium transporter
MPTLALILVFGAGMSVIALAGSITLLLSERQFRLVVMPLVALAAGSLLGGTFFHLLPEAVAELGNELGVYVALTAGFVSFFVLEQFLHWQHSHQPRADREPLGYLVLVADALHNLIGGIAVGGAFVIDTELGIVTWLVAAAHEVPQELGDFGILVHSGWKRRTALLWNLASAATFPLGGLIAYLAADAIDIAIVLPFAAGNFLYIAASDLMPQLRSPSLRGQLVQFSAFMLGLLLLLAVTWI